MKNIFLFLFISISSWGSAQNKTMEISVSPIAPFYGAIDNDFTFNLSAEYKMDDDFGIEFLFAKLPFSYNFNNPLDIIIFNTNSWNKAIIQTNYYFRPNRKMDRWYISGMLAAESTSGSFNFSRLPISVSTPVDEHIIDGNMQQYHVGIGMGYKAVFFEYMPIKLSFNVTRVFASHASNSLEDEIANFEKKTIGAFGIRTDFFIGYRFFIKKKDKKGAL